MKHKTYKGQVLEVLYDKAKSLFLEKKTFTEIGRKVKRHERTVRRWRDQFKWPGYSKKKKGYVAGKGYVQKQQKAKEMYESGDSPKRIRNQLCVSLGTVYSWIKKGQWEEPNDR